MKVRINEGKSVVFSEDLPLWKIIRYAREAGVGYLNRVFAIQLSATQRHHLKQSTVLEVEMDNGKITRYQ